MIRWDEPKASKKLKDVKMNSAQQKSREGTMYLLLLYASQEKDIEAIADELQLLFIDLQLTKTDIFTHCDILRKELDKNKWKLEVSSLVHDLVCREKLISTFQKRKKRQLKRQQRAKVTRAEKRQLKVSADRAALTVMRDPLDSLFKKDLPK